MSTETPSEMSAPEIKAVDYLLNRLWRVQFLAAAIVGLACVVLAIIIARWLTHADIEELKRLISDNKCECRFKDVRADASGNSVTISPDGNSFGQLVRDVLRKEGAVDGDVRGASSSIGSGER